MATLNRYMTFLPAQNLSPKWRLLLISFALVLSSCLIYAGSLKNDFVWDDLGAIVENPAIRDFRNIPGFFAKPLVLGLDTGEKETFGGERIHYYRPLVLVLHAIEYRGFGIRPFGYKMTNLALNGFAVLLAFLFARELLGDDILAFLAALAYSAIPARGEAVYWVYSDAYLLAGIFSLLTCLAYHHRRQGLALFSMVLGLLSHEGVVLVPLVLIGYEWLICGAHREDLWGVKHVLTFGLLALAYLVLRHKIVGPLPFSPLPIADMIRAAAFLSVRHLQILFVPEASVTMYLYTPGMFAAVGVVGFRTMLLAGLILAAGLILWRFGRPLLFWYLWFFVWIATTFNVGSYANYLMAEKTLYLASLGPCVLLAAGVWRVRRCRKFGVFLLLLMVGWHAWQVAERAPSWQNSDVYLQKLVEFEPAYDVAHYQLAVLAMQGGRYDKAIGHLDRVSALRPDLRDGLNDILASAYAEKGRIMAERGELVQSLADLETARRHAPGRSSTYNALGIVHFLRGETALAVSHWQKAVALDPGNGEARENLRRYGPPGGRP